MGKLKYCSHCAEFDCKADKMFPIHVPGYKDTFEDQVTKCLDCGNDLIELSMDCKDYRCLIKISTDKKFIDSMIKLAESDPIEYQLKMSQFRANLAQQKRSSDNTPKCPTCGSTNIEKISVGKKVTGGFFLGIFSSDVRNTMHCKDCGAKW